MLLAQELSVERQQYLRFRSYWIFLIDFNGKLLLYILRGLNLSSDLWPIYFQCQIENVEVLLHAKVKRDTLPHRLQWELISEFPVPKSNEGKSFLLNNFIV